MYKRRVFIILVCMLSFGMLLFPLPQAQPQDTPSSPRAAATTAATPMRDSATIIMYHRFDEQNYPSTNTTLAQFEAHLRLLTNGDYHVMPLPEIIATLQAGQTLPDRTVAITIDDAYKSVYDKAWPRLKALNLPFTLFVATAPIDQNLPGYMDWAQIRELQSHGVEIGSQTNSHPHLHRLEPSQIRAELSISNQRFIAELGKQPDFFAYPYGEYSGFVIDIVKSAGFRAGFGQNSGIMHGGSDFFELPRFAFNEAYGSLDRLRLAIDGLPLKVTDMVPRDMVLSENPPLYGFTLAPEMGALSQLRCFASDYGQIKVMLLGRRAEMRVPGAFAGPRARINCTLPVEGAVEGAVEGTNRWRWFGRQFLTR